MDEFEYRWLAESGPPRSLPLTYVYLADVAFLTGSLGALLDNLLLRFRRSGGANFPGLEDIIGQLEARNSQKT